MSPPVIDWRCMSPDERPSVLHARGVTGMVGLFGLLGPVGRAVLGVERSFRS